MSENPSPAGGPPPTVLLACSVLKDEIQALWKLHWPQARLVFLDSMLHMKPRNLGEALSQAVDGEPAGGGGTVLIYGDCCGAMEALARRPGVARTRGNNCYDLLLGREEYRRLSREGAFFLLPEWTLRWREIFERHLGLTLETATGLMRDIHKKLLYLDTGLAPLPEAALREFSEYCGLPWEARAVTLAILRESIQDALNELEREESNR